MEKKKEMRVSPVNQGYSPSFTMLKRSENTQPQKPQGYGVDDEEEFKNILKDLECQPIKPAFKGHWPAYSSVPTDVISKGVINDPYPSPKKSGQGRKLDFNV